MNRREEYRRNKRLVVCLVILFGIITIANASSATDIIDLPFSLTVSLLMFYIFQMLKTDTEDARPHIIPYLTDYCQDKDDIINNPSSSARDVRDAQTVKADLENVIKTVSTTCTACLTHAQDN